MPFRSAFSDAERSVALLCVACLLASASSLVVRSRDAEAAGSTVRTAADPVAVGNGGGDVTTDAEAQLPPPAEPSPEEASPDPVLGDHVAAVTTTDPLVVRAEPHPGSAEVSRIRPGILLPVGDFVDGFFAVLTPCQIDGWVPADRVEAHPVAAGTPGAFHEATIVLDPGHGGIMPGAVGPTGLTEAEANLGIVQELTSLLAGPRRIDPSGRVLEGGDHGPPRVMLTRSADYTAGLDFRTALADGLGAHAFVSVHNNASPDGPRTDPGTETFYQLDSPRSKRLAGLIQEEVVATLRSFPTPWVGNRDAGAKYRVGEGGDDYYGLLRKPDVPTALAELAFLSNPAEEALLRQPEVQHALAEALYRALVRYVTTEDPGSGFVEPIPRPSGPSGALHSACTDPA